METSFGITGSANAAIKWTHIEMVNQASQQCLAAQDNNVHIGISGTTVLGCMAGGTGWVWLTSGLPDSNGDANVYIQTNDGAQPLCLEADGPG